jgi:hypothetical protein
MELFNFLLGFWFGCWGVVVFVTVLLMLFPPPWERLRRENERLLTTVATLESEIDNYRRLLGESHARERKPQ